jgi:hypothetical protein
MSMTYKMAVGTVIAVSSAILITMAGPATAAPPRAASNYCLQYYDGGTDCGFASRAECEATTSGWGGECYRDIYGKEGETLYW